MDIGNLIRKKREELGLTQGELAGKVGFKPAIVSHWETGKRKVSPKGARAMEITLGIPREKLCPEVFG